jgi:hypothetical protein
MTAPHVPEKAVIAYLNQAMALREYAAVVDSKCLHPRRALTQLQA